MVFNTATCYVFFFVCFPKKFGSNCVSDIWFLSDMYWYSHVQRCSPLYISRSLFTVNPPLTITRSVFPVTLPLSASPAGWQVDWYRRLCKACCNWPPSLWPLALRWALASMQSMRGSCLSERRARPWCDWTNRVRVSHAFHSGVHYLSGECVTRRKTTGPCLSYQCEHQLLGIEPSPFNLLRDLCLLFETFLSADN